MADQVELVVPESRRYQIGAVVALAGFSWLGLVGAASDLNLVAASMCPVAIVACRGVGESVGARAGSLHC